MSAGTDTPPVPIPMRRPLPPVRVPSGMPTLPLGLEPPRPLGESARVHPIAPPQGTATVPWIVSSGSLVGLLHVLMDEAIR